MTLGAVEGIQYSFLHKTKPTGIVLKLLICRNPFNDSLCYIYLCAPLQLQPLYLPFKFRIP